MSRVQQSDSDQVSRQRTQARQKHHSAYFPSWKGIWQQDRWGQKLKLALSWIQNTRVLRAVGRYSYANGALLAGGIAYSTLFSLAAALTIGITITMKILGSNAQLRNAVFDSLSQALPGVLQWEGQDGIVDPEHLVMNVSLSIPSIIAAVVLVFSATKMMSSLKSSIRAVFAIEQVPDNPALDKLRDLVGFIVLALGVVATGMVGLVNSTLGQWIIDFLHIKSSWGSALLSLGSLLINALIDAGILWVLIRGVARVRPQQKDAVLGLGIFAVGAAVIRSLGTSALGSSGGNALLVSFAALVTLLLWTNLLSRLVLLASAFIANPPKVKKVKEPEQLHANETPNYVTLSDPLTLDWPQHRLSGTVDITYLEGAKQPDGQKDTSSVSPDYRGAKRWRSQMLHYSSAPWQSKVSTWIRARIKHHQQRIVFLEGLQDQRRNPRT